MYWYLRITPALHQTHSSPDLDTAVDSGHPRIHFTNPRSVIKEINMSDSDRLEIEPHNNSRRRGMFMEIYLYGQENEWAYCEYE